MYKAPATNPNKIPYKLEKAQKFFIQEDAKIPPGNTTAPTKHQVLNPIFYAMGKPKGILIVNDWNISGKIIYTVP